MSAYEGCCPEATRLHRAYCLTSNKVEQTLGKALGYPLYGPDMFEDGVPNGDVCVGDHVPESLAAEAAARIRALTAALRDLTVTATCRYPLMAVSTTGGPPTDLKVPCGACAPCLAAALVAEAAG